MPRAKTWGIYKRKEIKKMPSKQELKEDARLWKFKTRLIVAAIIITITLLAIVIGVSFK